MKLYSVSVYWRNNKPGGIGLSFGPPGFSSADLEAMFQGDTVKDYFRASDEQLGTDIVACYLDQLETLAVEARQRPLPIAQALIAALNIMWLTERGFIPNDEFNGLMMTFVE